MAMATLFGTDIQEPKINRPPLPLFTAETAARPLDRWGSNTRITPDDRRGQYPARTSVTGQTIRTVETKEMHHETASGRASAPTIEFEMALGGHGSRVAPGWVCCPRLLRPPSPLSPRSPPTISSSQRASATSTRSTRWSSTKAAPSLRRWAECITLISIRPERLRQGRRTISGQDLVVGRFAPVHHLRWLLRGRSTEGDRHNAEEQEEVRLDGRLGLPGLGGR
jgi:hypothetical protein